MDDEAIEDSSDPRVQDLIGTCPEHGTWLDNPELNPYLYPLSCVGAQWSATGPESGMVWPLLARD
jgi:hypothetical protein